MAKNNVYPLVIPPGCGYPQFVPVDPKKSKAKWLPYGRRVTPVVLAGGRSEDYFQKRYVTPRPKERHDDASYPRIWDMPGEER